MARSQMGEGREGGLSDRFILRMIEAPAATSPLDGVVLILTALAAAWGITYVAGGAGTFPPHLFYVPVMLAAARFALPGAAITAIVAGIIAGPLLPADVRIGSTQQLSDWVARMGFFLLNGALMAIFITRLQRAVARERRVALEEHDLAIQKTTLIHAVSHEFRTPLTVIEGAAKTLVNLNLVAEEGLPLLEGLDRATASLDQLVMGLLAAGGALDESVESEQGLSLEAVCREIAESVGGRRPWRACASTTIMGCPHSSAIRPSYGSSSGP